MTIPEILKYLDQYDLEAKTGTRESLKLAHTELLGMIRKTIAEANMSAMERDIARSLNEALRERVAELRAEVDRLTNGR